MLPDSKALDADFKISIDMPLEEFRNMALENPEILQQFEKLYAEANS
jgi:hypothetical protein